MITSRNVLRVTPFLLSAFITNNLQAVMVSRNNLTSRVRDEAQSYLYAQGYSTYAIPQRIQPEYQSKLNDAVQRLYNRLDYEGRTYADSEEIKSVVRDIMNSFVNATLKTLVLSSKLNDQARTMIYQAAQQQGINPNAIPASMVTEYTSRTNRVIDNLHRIMNNDRREYVRIHEIETEIKKEMNALFARIKHDQTSASNNSFSWSDFFGFGASSAAHAGANTASTGAASAGAASAHTPHAASAASSASSNTVSNYQLDTKVAELADEILREKGYSEAALPAQVVSDYVDKIQAVIRQMRKKMSDWNMSSVTVNDIKSALRNQLQSIFDTLTYI